MEKKKHLYIEVIRIIAIYWVIFNHTEEKGYFLFSTYEKGSFAFWMSVVPAVFCRVGVPLFFAISGALLLGKNDEEIKYVWKKRIPRIIFILVVFSFLYYILRVVMGLEQFKMSRFIIGLLTKGWNMPFWFLYAYIAFLSSLPFLRSFVYAMQDKNTWWYLICVAVVVQGIIPVVQYLLWKGEFVLNGYLTPGWLTYAIFIYPCIGYFLHSKFKIEDKKQIWYMLFIDIMCIGISSFMTYYKAIIDKECSEIFLDSFVLINMITVFSFCKYYFKDISIETTKGRMIQLLGSCTFGVYLIHVLVIRILEYFLHIGDVFTEVFRINELITSYLICVIVMSISSIGALIMKRIPFLGRMV